jgi:hypothetical protein
MDGSTKRLRWEMAEKRAVVPYLRGLAARLRSLAMTEPLIADQLQQIADEAEGRADAIETGQTRRGRL